MQDIIRQLLAALGENPSREGLFDTPRRVEKSLKFLTSGYTADVISTSIKGHDRYIQFADSVEDIWGKVAWLIDQGAPTT